MVASSRRSGRSAGAGTLALFGLTPGLVGSALGGLVIGLGGFPSLAAATAAGGALGAILAVPLLARK